MTDYSYVASYDLRKVLLQELQDKNIIDLNDYIADGFDKPLKPIIPAQQVPEFNNQLPGKTYIVYDIQQRPTGVQWWMSEEIITFDVISRDPAEIQTIINLATDLFRRYDESAVDLNKYLDGNTDFLYHHIMIDSVFSPEPFGTEGDYQVGSVVFSYNYSRKTDPKGRF